MKQPDDFESVTLPVHRISTELGDRDTEVRHTVRCPASDQTVELRTCEACPQLIHLQRDEAGPRTVSCHPRRSPRPPAPGESFESLLSPLLEHTRVDELMTRDVHCASEELCAEELAVLFATRRVSGMPVLDEDSQLVGVVSRSDLLRASSDAEDVPVLHPERAGATTTELMNTLPVVVREGTTLPLAAAVMSSAHVHRVLVVSSEGNMVGILTPMDIVRWLARKAGYAV